MKIIGASTLIVLIACLSFQAASQNTTNQPLDLNPENLNIVSTEHTAEYLAKTGGLADPSAVSSMSVAGNWSIELRDDKGRLVASMNLQLFQASNQVFGAGSMEAFGQNVQAITAYGYLAEGSMMNIGVVSFEEVNLFRLAINGAGPSGLSGSFAAYSSKGGEPLTGSVLASRIVSRSLS
jgi:hypothetical protein